MIYFKKITLKITVALLITSSCQQTMNISEKIIDPITPSNDVIVFFEKYLPMQSFPSTECFFFNKEDNEDKCIIINNVDEFKKNFSCSSTKFPDIDFESNTLIIGQHRVSNICDYTIKQEIVLKSDKAILNLNWSCPNGAYASFGTLYYWGIYPKFQVKTISVNITA